MARMTQDKMRRALADKAAAAMAADPDLTIEAAVDHQLAATHDDAALDAAIGRVADSRLRSIKAGVATMVRCPGYFDRTI